MTDQVAGASGADIKTGTTPQIGGAKFDAAVEAQNDAPTGTYTVQKGDTLWGISKKYLDKGISYSQIQSANNMGSSTLIKPGMKLNIPLADDLAGVAPKLADEPKPATQTPVLKQAENVIPAAVPNTVVAPDNKVTIPNDGSDALEAMAKGNVPTPQGQKGMVENLKDQLLDGVGNVTDAIKNASNSDAAELLGKIGIGAIPDAVLGAVKFEFGGEPVLVAELVPTPKKGLENWDGKNSTTFISYKGRIYTMTPNGAVETGKPIFPMQPASQMFPALAKNKLAQKVILFGNDRSGLDLDGAVSPKFNLRSRNLGAIVALNDPAAKADAKRQNLAEKAVDVLVADKMAPLEKAEMASDAVTAGIVLASAGAATPGAVVKKVITKTGLHFAKKEIIAEVKEAIKDEIKDGATWYAGVAYRANVQVDPKSDDPLKLQTPVGTAEIDPVPQAAQDYIMQRTGGILSNF